MSIKIHSISVFCEVMFFFSFFCRSNFLTRKNGGKFAHTHAFWRVDFSFTLLCEETVIVSISVSSGTYFK